MKLFKVAALGSVAVVALSGCGLGSGGSSAASSKVQQSVDSSAKLSGTISFQTWALKNDKFTPYFTKLIADFEKQHPGTTINWIDQPGDGYADKVSSEISSNSLPDVVNLPPDIAYAAVKAGALLNLAKSDPKINQTYVKSGLSDYTYKGVDGTYAYPWYLGTDVSYWNTDILKKAGIDQSNLPTTFDGLVAAAKKVHDATGGKQFLMSRKPNLYDIMSTGAPIMNSDGTKFTFNTDAAAAMIGKYADAYKAGYMPREVLSSDYQGNDTLFKKQQVGWTTSTGYYITSLKTDNPTLVPKVIGSPAIGLAPLYSQGISVSAKSKNPALALAFAQFVTSNANQTAFVGVAKGFLPGTQAAQSDPRFTTSDGTPAGNAAVLGAKTLPKAKSLGAPQWDQQDSDYLDQQIALAMTGKQTPKQALDNAVNKANSLLSK
ncbi:sugar ABC transporter substrate-binding protein [Flexivirga sp. ID2601S]|uniref:Sugar ABC transporter substrate-binding protein n=1 Tax=Flexivirga aerilata TaxID=1656889 RepID=A0A849AH30_9MICO|nr:sugar ABC transporter substrate-binding protein [Flexivirga aerilata]NNG39755.1 sugar ABC transporter substrate-binding protein [Flexivirga aerilata]